ncbi:MAG: signal recognition particle protein [Candidatus Eisenbacteria bacterium]|nr:signal recognition particle protein [Candidatus Eisenbacteria bacterium]
MFEQLTGRLEEIFRRLRGQGVLTPENIRETLREVRRALLEADVHYEVARGIVREVERRAVGEEVLRSLSPGQQVIRVVHEVLVETLGGKARPLEASGELPTRLLVVGLQGSGKTTFAAKLGQHLKERKQISLLAACDLARPAAVEQLESLGRSIGVKVHVDRASGDPVLVATAALKAAKESAADFLIVDTAGRLHVDADLMEQLRRVREAVAPHQTILVLDGMAGQEAVPVAAAFKEQMPIDGLALTKMDGDARGGAALSVRAATGIPIFFLGTGEKTSALEIFHPDRLASRILGMGDLLSLVEKVQASADLERARKMQERLERRQFTLEDFLEQLRQVKRMGPLEDLVRMIPGASKALVGGASLDERQIGKVEAILQSMTPRERERPETIDGSRRRRIAQGSGTVVQDVNRVLRDYQLMRRLLQQARKGKRRGMPRLGGF